MDDNQAKSGFEVLDHPADMGLLVHASSLKKLFEEACNALNSTLLDFDSVETGFTETISVSASDYEHLMYDWLSEILFLFDAEGKVFTTVEVEELGDSAAEAQSSGELKLVAKVCGGEFDPERHQIKTYVKAITLHQLEISQSDEIYQLRLFLDI